MRKLITGLKVGLLVVGLLAMVANPAMAQWADPLTLATSGALLPFFGSGNNISVLETAAPVSNIPGMHVVFYNAFCTRGEDRPLPLTTNDVDVRVIAANSPAVPVQNADGLVAIANLFQPNTVLTPLDWDINEALHSRIYWFDLNDVKFRVLEPIILETFAVGSFGVAGVWNPIRTGVTFWAPDQSPGTTLRTTLYLICPRNTIQGIGDITEAFPTAAGFPDVRQNTQGNLGFRSTIPSGSLTGFVYDDDENPLASINATCNCLTTLPLTSLSTIYTQQTSDTYTELVTAQNFAGFTGYKAITHTGAAVVDFFGRLSNGNRFDILSNGFIVCGFGAPGPCR
jgi:hypothetical protein